MQQTRRLNAILVGVGTIALLAPGGFTRPCFAQTAGDSLTATGGAVGDQFGNSVGLSGTTAIVGAPRKGSSGSPPSDAGAAYVFVDSGGWTQQAQLLASDRAANDLFGYAVAVSGDYAVVGAPDDDDNGFSCGAIYVFHRVGTAWTQTQKIAGAAAGDRFGISVAIEGSRMAVGASEASGKGRAYVYQLGVSWAQTFTVSPADLDSGDEFGLSVALSSDTLVVGARNDNHTSGPGGTSHFGAVYVYLYSSGSWSQQAVLHASDASDGDQFGNAVAVRGDVAAIGAPQNEGMGAAYVFDRSGSVWTESAKVRSANTSPGDQIGFSVGIDGGRLVAGANAGFSPAGYVGIFQRDGNDWNEDLLTNPVTPNFGDNGFGTSVAIDGSLFLGGAPGSVFTQKGSANFYTIDAPPPPPGDTDGDGLDDALEIAMQAGGSCVDPGNPDSDGDGLSDGYEANFGPDPCNSDSDADGLSDGAEVNTHGTVPTLSDTDGDGLSDGAEVNTYHTDPTLVDTDGDGLSDGAEVNTHHTVPTLIDTDGDGLSDGAEINTHHTNPTLNDTDGDGLSDGQEISLGTNPQLDDTDGDGLTDTLEVAYGTSPLVGDTDHDGLSDNQEITLAHGTGCPDPLHADSDGDALNDGPEVGANWDPCDSDTDGDGLADGVEVNVEHTNPLDPDSDHDGLTDGYEVTLRGAGTCPKPLNHDSDGDGIDDGNEVTAGSGPCDADSDDDGLSDFNEGVFHTNPLVGDTDGDGLLDGAEVDMAHGGGCPNPLAIDSDGDTLSDGAEVNTRHTNPCNIDTDGDSLPDNTDPNPLVPAINPCMLAQMALATAGEILDTPTSQFVGPNNNTRLARKVGMAADVALAAVKICAHNYSAARALLTVAEQKTDGLGSPPDWISPGPAQASIHSDLRNLIALLNLLP